MRNISNITHVDINTIFFLCDDAVHTELLYIYKEDLTIELRRSIEIFWEQIRESLKRFDYYFGHFTEQQVMMIQFPRRSKLLIFLLDYRMLHIF